MNRNEGSCSELEGESLGCAVRLRELCQMVGLSRSSVYNLMRSDASFPRGFLVSTRARAFFVKDVLKWLESRSTKHSL